MRVVYSLKSRDLNGVAAEAAWAESMGLRRNRCQRNRPRSVSAASGCRHYHQSCHPGNPRCHSIPPFAHGAGLYGPRSARFQRWQVSASVWETQVKGTH